MPAKPAPAKKAAKPAAAPAAAMPELHRDFEEFIDAQCLDHFGGAEFTEYWSRTRDGVRNECPPTVLWQNIVPSLVVLDQIREDLGKPITLNSTYRSPRYNRAVGGEPNSFHMRFMAIDFSADCSAEHLHVVATAQRGRIFRMPGNGGTFRFAGGIGLYVKSGFVHIDCRKTAADWKGN